MKINILFITLVPAVFAIITACATTVTNTYTDMSIINSDHLREIRSGPWEIIDRTQYRITLNHDEKIIYVRGRESVVSKDYRDNFKFYSKKPTQEWFYEAEGRIKIHAGFLNRYDSVRVLLLDVAYEYPDYAIDISGYSLGGAWTQIFLLDILLLWPDRDIQTILYAPANPWRKLPGKYQEELKQNTVFVKSHWDPVTWMRLIGFNRYGNNIIVGKWWRFFPPQHFPKQMVRALDELFD